jgi:pyridoxal phosphate enzyme (YggS family)
MQINQSVLAQIQENCLDHKAQWVAVTKMRPTAVLKELYNLNIKTFGENKAQELNEKYQELPKDIDWHFIGHLQSNKVRSIIDKVTTIHAVDSEKLLLVIQNEAHRIGKKMAIFIQVHVAKEETKYGFSVEEAFELFQRLDKNDFPNIAFKGLMAMASYTDNQEQIRKEFESVCDLKVRINALENWNITDLSMGMSGDYKIALESGSSLIRIGSILYK